MSAQKLVQPVPVFTYSIGKTWLLWTGVIALLLGASAYSAYTSPQLPAPPVFFFVLGLLGLTTVWREATPEVRRAVFSESKASFVGRHSSFELDYSGIVKVEPKLSLLFGPRMHITVKGSPKRIILVKNPKSEALDMDLYSWLLLKTRRLTSSEG